MTSGEKVHSIRYQLGQSTIIDLGVKPEVVICGNKNYFNIEKLKTGIAVQPLSNFSTNLTILSSERRFLFYLLPSGAQSPDGFVEVKWIPPQETKLINLRPIKPDTQIELNRKIKLETDLQIEFVRAKVSPSGRQIFDIIVKNDSAKLVALNSIEIIAYTGEQPLKHQALVWENETVKEKSYLSGRLIIANVRAKNLILHIRFSKRITKINMKGS